METGTAGGDAVALAEDSYAAPRPAASRHPLALIGRLYWANPAASRAIISVLAVAALWEAAGWYAVMVGKKIFFVPLTSVIASFFNLLGTGELQHHAAVSFQEFIIGFALAATIGITIGLLMGAIKWISDFLDPWVSFLYSTPTIALAPLFILWLGIDVASKAAVVFLLAVLPIIINTATGIRSTDQTFVETARSFCASRWQTFSQVLIPSGLPFIVAGLRLGVGRGIIGVVVGEIFGAKAGLGFMIQVASQVFDTATLFVGILVLAGTGVLAVLGLQRLERHLAPWRDDTIRA